MNCKPGDLAVVIRSCAGNEGKIVRCIKLVPNDTAVMPDGSFWTRNGWITEPELPGWNPGIKAASVPDQNLRPIRDNDGEDESFSWAGKPQGVTA